MSIYVNIYILTRLKVNLLILCIYQIGK